MASISCSHLIILFTVTSLSLVSLTTCSSTTTDPVVKTKYGTFIGEQRHFHENSIDAFEGIRYAKPPVKDLRFEPPQMIQKQPDVEFVVKRPGSACMQWILVKFDGDLLAGDEDCLFLNIYVPSNKSSERLPVIFHIHGGLFIFGQGPMWGPGHLLEKNDMILVHFNYRLGVLGYLSSGDSTIPGNMGFKDQALALKWIHENIEAFGGDPNNIVIAGFSAGAAAAHAHLLSPLSKGLFSKGISHSGSATSFWFMPENMRKKFEFIKSELGCMELNPNATLTCLKAKNAEEIFRIAVRLFEFMWFPAVNFALVVEPPSEHAFLTDTPLNLLKQKSYPTDIPWIFSASEADGLFVTAAMIRNKNYSVVQQIDEKWNEVAPKMFGYEWIESRLTQNLISKGIKDHYFKDTRISIASFKTLTSLFTDRFFRHGISIATEHQTNYYVYNFNFTVTHGFGAVLSNEENATWLGVAHGDDILLIYDTWFKHDDSFTEDENLMSQQLVNIYRTFSRNGVPEFGKVTPEKAVDMNGKLKYVDIQSNDRFVVRARDDFGDLKFWNSLNISDVL